MDSFNEEKKKALFEKISEKQLKYVKKTMLIIFALIGAIFLVMGLVLIACNVRDVESDILVGTVFVPIGAFFILLGVIIRLVTPKMYNYENYKKRIAKYGYYSTFDLYITLALSEERIAELENKLRELEERL